MLYFEKIISFAVFFLLFSILNLIEEICSKWSYINTHCVYSFQGLVAIEIKLVLNFAIKIYIEKYSVGIQKSVNGFHENRSRKNQQEQ